MHTAATWLELAAHTRATADGILDWAERREMLDIAANYEQQAQETASYSEPTRYFGACPLLIW
jgi:hypothetical protein